MRAVQCPKCAAWCLLGLADGFKAAVDVAPSTQETYVATLVAGRSVYAIVNGKLRLLVGRSAEEHTWAVRRNEHACGSKAFKDFPVKAPQAARARPVCDLRRLGGWIPPRECPRRSQPLGAGGPVSCDQCEPPPFDLEAARELFIRELGATVIEEIPDESCAPVETRKSRAAKALAAQQRLPTD